MNRRFNRLILVGAFLAVAALCLSIGLVISPEQDRGAILAAFRQKHRAAGQYRGHGCETRSRQ